MKKNHGTNFVATNVAVSHIRQLGILIGFIVSVITEMISHYFFLLSDDEKKVLLQNKASLAEKIRTALMPIFAVAVDEFVEAKTYWQTIYKNNFGIDVDFTDIVVPPKPAEGKWRLLFIAKELTIDFTYGIYGKVMSGYNAKMWKDSYYGTSIDAKVTDNIRDPKNGSYAIWVRDDQESDLQYRGQSTKQADPNKTIGETLLERMVHGIIHFIETKKHLDEKGFTLCSGSRAVDGYVPDMDWNPGHDTVHVFYYGVDYYNSYGGVRQVVSV